jgi:hypothetical protein
MEAPKNTLLILDSVNYDLSMLVKIVGAAPTVEIELAKLNSRTDRPGPLAELHDVRIKPTWLGEKELPVAVYKQGNGFTILMGLERLSMLMQADKKGTAPTTVKAKLVSSPALKKARIVETPVETRPSESRPAYRGDSGYGIPLGGYRSGESTSSSGGYTPPPRRRSFES